VKSGVLSESCKARLDSLKAIGGHVLCEPDRHGEVVGWWQKGGRKTFKGRVTSSHRTHRAPQPRPLPTSLFIKHHVGFSNRMGIVNVLYMLTWVS
jgi:hypothetical protein